MVKTIQEQRNRAFVKVLMADSDTYIRQAFSNALTAEGYRDIRTLSRLSLVRDVLTATVPDLVILDCEMPDGDAIEFVREIRNGRLGRNPFVPIILTVWDSDGISIDEAVNSGVDLILAKPLAPAQLFARIDSLVIERKPFVVTADYIGPDRRERISPNDENSFEVPNTLRDKVAGTPIDEEALSALIETTLREINSSRLQQGSLKLACQVEVLIRAFSAGKVGKSTRQHIGRIITSTEDIVMRVQNTEFEQLKGLCESLIKVAREVYRRPKKADQKQVDLMRPLSQSILVSTNPELKSQLPAAEIENMVSNYATRVRSRISTSGSEGNGASA